MAYFRNHFGVLVRIRVKEENVVHVRLQGCIVVAVNANVERERAIAKIRFEANFHFEAIT